MLGSRPLSRTTAFAPRSDSRREKPFHQKRPALFVASPNHNPKLPILSISYPSRFLPRPAFCHLASRFLPILSIPVPLSASVPLSVSRPAFCLRSSRFLPPLSASPRFLPPRPAFCLPNWRAPTRFSRSSMKQESLSNGRPQAGVAIAGEVADILRRDEDLITRLTDCRRTSCQDDVGVECIGRSGR